MYIYIYIYIHIYIYIYIYVYMYIFCPWELLYNGCSLNLIGDCLTIYDFRIDLFLRKKM